MIELSIVLLLLFVLTDVTLIMGGYIGLALAFTVCCLILYLVLFRGLL